MKATTPFLILITVASLSTGGRGGQLISGPNSLQKVKSTYPYLSGTVFRALCDHRLDEIPFDPLDVKCADLVYVNAQNLHVFFTELIDQIRQPFILVTHLTTMSFPGRYEKFLDHPMIGAWFTKNPDRIHPKLHPLPIGISHFPMLQSRKNFEAIFNQKAESRHRFLLLMLSVGTNRRERAPVVELFHDKPYCSHLPRSNARKYFKALRETVFVLAPRGTGPDTYRIWEALLCGAIPITKKSTVSHIYEDLPVIVVDDWHEVTKPFLEKKLLEISNKKYRLEKIHPQYWVNRIEKVKINIAQKNRKKICLD